MSQFKVGDQVRVIDDIGFEHYNIGRTGRINQIDDSHLPVYVIFDDNREFDSDWGHFDGIELMSVGNRKERDELISAAVALSDAQERFNKALAAVQGK